ncbi:MAG: hypothetical protein WD058_08940, partial [Dehalococcoidia bacterium]
NGAGGSLQRSMAAGAGTSAGGRVQRGIEGDGGSADASDDGRDEDRQREAWMRFTESDDFEGRLMELIQDRLLGEIERRGGRYGGWFA